MLENSSEVKQKSFKEHLARANRVNLLSDEERNLAHNVVQLIRRGATKKAAELIEVAQEDGENHGDLDLYRTLTVVSQVFKIAPSRSIPCFKLPEGHHLMVVSKNRQSVMESIAMIFGDETKATRINTLPKGKIVAGGTVENEDQLEVFSATLAATLEFRDGLNNDGGSITRWVMETFRGIAIEGWLLMKLG